MRKICKAAFYMLLIGSFALLLGACKKNGDEGKLPALSFKTDQGYIATDATVAKNTAVKIGINASKSEDKDVLTKFSITRSRDNGPDSTMVSKDLPGSDGD